MEFEAFEKIPRLSRNCIITEKIDGTNGQICIEEVTPSDYTVWVGSRNRWLSEKEDNHGFYKWAQAHKEQLCLELGVGRHYGEWWGTGVNKRYKGVPKTFSLFNTTRWQAPKDQGLLTTCSVVPELYAGLFTFSAIEECMDRLRKYGSVAGGSDNEPEGIVIFHEASRSMFKKTLWGDEAPKGVAQE